MFGEPGNAARQRSILLDAIDGLKTMNRPGETRELPYRWKGPQPGS
jgi:hypothetical protein